MKTLDLLGVAAHIPDEWQSQGMVTLTLPTEDKNVRPNIILTKEFLPRPVELADYFARIRESIEKRGIKDLKVSEEKDLAISGVRGKMMLCSWDVSAMAEALASRGGEGQPNVPAIKPGQRVKQIQVTFLKELMAVNITASFPEEHFETYYKAFQEFIKSLKID